MITLTIKKAMTLMNFTDSYAVSVREPLFLNEMNWLFLKCGFKPTEALFISYAYKGANYQTYFNDVSAIFAKAGIQLTDIKSGSPAVLIAAAKAIVFGGGDYTTLSGKMNSLITPAFNPYDAIKISVDGGTPYIGWNEGSNIISPKYFIPASNTISTGINASPFQIVCDFQVNLPQIRNTVKTFLINNPAIKKAICQVSQLVPGGSSIRLEESGAGMIDSVTDPYPATIRFEIVAGQLQES